MSNPHDTTEPAETTAENNPAGGQTGGISELAATVEMLSKKIDDMNDGFSKFRKQTNGDLKRVRLRTREASEVENLGNDEHANTREDPAAIVRLQRAITGIPDDLAGDALDQLSAGVSASQVLREVQAIKRGFERGSENGKTSASGGEITKKPPRDDAASAPRQNSTPRPTTRTDFFKLRKKDPQASLMLLRDSTFQLENLPP